MTGYGNGECVKFILILVSGLLAVYQGFCLGWARVALGVR
jgi:hypothetical protein